MFCLMQKLHGCGFVCHLSRPIFSLRSDNTRQVSGRGRGGGRRGNAKNEGLMQKTNHRRLIANIISGTPLA